MRFRVIRRSGAAVLIEWDDGRLHRATLPAEVVAGREELDNEVLAAAIEYGEDWEAKLARVTPGQVADRLRRMGFWTVEDVRKDPTAAARVLREAQCSLNDLLRQEEV